jgi:hypothetical protein
VIVRGFQERGGVLGEAGAAEARPGVQELAADAVVEAHAEGDILHVGTGSFAQIGDLVDEGDLGGEECIGRVFDQLRRAPRREHQWRLVQRQRPVDIAQHFSRAFVRGPDHDAVGKFEVADRRTLAQEFRIGRDRELG